MGDDDQCCIEAGKIGDVKTLDLMCAIPADEIISDEYFTYEAPTCTRMYDRDTNYYTKSDVEKTTLIYTHEEKCIEEIVSVDTCCTAKLNGSDGTGLEDACAQISF